MFKETDGRRNPRLATDHLLRDSRAGFSLVEVVVTVALLAIFVTGSLSFSGWVTDSVKTESSKADRNVESIEMLKLLTQPVYFGALSKFDTNSQLAKCMTLDQVFCDSRNEYPVTAYDLKTNSVLAKTSTSLTGGIASKISFKVHCANSQVSCDKADFYTVKIITSIVAPGGSVRDPIVKQGIVAPEFSNVATFVPDASVVPGRPINIMVWVDNSNSMAFARNQIKDALNSLVNRLSTMNARIGIFPILGESSQRGMPRFYIDGNGEKQPLPPPPLPPGFVYYDPYESIPPLSWPYNINMTPSTLLNTNYSPYRLFSFLPSDSQADRDEKLEAMKTRIDYLFANVSDVDLDRPFCDILKLLEGPVPQTFFTFDSMTPTAVMIITNENDQTESGWFSTLKCQRSQVVKYTVNDPYYHYFGSLQSMQMNMTVNATKDGAPYLAPFVFNYYIPYDASRVVGTDCMALALQDQANGRLDTALRDYLSRSNHGWTYTGGFTVNSCNENVFTAYMIRGALKQPTNVCEQVANGTVTVSRSYIPGSCREVIASGGSSGSSDSYTVYFTEGASGDVVQAVHQSINNRIGTSNFYFIPIVHPNTTTCDMTSGAEVGTRYLQLANKLGANSSVIPVCSPDYTRPLDKFIQWTESLGVNDLELPPSIASNFSGIALIRSDTEITLTRNVDYTLNGTTLVFITGTVLPNDVIKIYLN